MAEAGGEFLAILSPVRAGMVVDGPLPEELPVLAAHLAWLQQLAADGRVVIAGRIQEADPSAVGLVVFRAGDREEATALARQDPAVAGGLLSVEIHPFRIAVGGS